MSTKNKTKKRTRAQILDRLHEIAYDTEAIKQAINFPEPHKYITVVNALNKGKTVYEAHCHSCGEKYLREYIPLYSFKTNGPTHFECPKCGNRNIAQSKTERLNEKRHKLILKTDDGFEFVNFNAYETHEDSDDWHVRDSRINIDIKQAGVFDRNSGFYVAVRGTPTYWNKEKAYKVLRRMSFDEDYIISQLGTFTDSNVSVDECGKLLKEANEFYKKQAAESSAKSEVRRKKKEEKERLANEARIREEEIRKQEHEAMRLADKRCVYDAKPVDIDSIIAQPILNALYSYNTDMNRTRMVGCAKCGVVEEVVVVFDEEGEYTCPHCGNHVEHMINTSPREKNAYSKTVIVFENTDFEENDLLLRVFQYSCGFDSDFNLVKNIYESKRIFAGSEPSVYLKDYAGRFEKDNDRFRNLNVGGTYWSRFSPNVVVGNSNDEIVEIVQRSCLRYSGLLDAWGLGKFRYNWNTDIRDLCYLRAWYKNPGIETVMKSNLTNITDYLVDNPYYMHDGKALHEILGVEAAVAKMVQKSDCDYDTMIELNCMYKADRTMTLAIYDQIVGEGLHKNVIEAIAERHGIPYDRIMKYLQAAYDHQCILKNECLTIWSDYLNMASLIGVNLADKAKRFPTSLKKEHDIAAFAYKAAKIEIDKKAFAEQAKINAKYEFEDDNMVVIIPQSPQEVIEEANHQNNCLRSYIDRVKRGETVVAFVRKKSEPEKTFLSAEICRGELRQLKGWCNSDPRTKEIVEFTKKWAEACDIVIKC